MTRDLIINGGACLLKAKLLTMRKKEKMIEVICEGCNGPSWFPISAIVKTRAEAYKICVDSIDYWERKAKEFQQ